MTQLRCTLFALLGLTLAACGDDPTVVALNISYGDGISGMESVHVLITQGGQTFDTTFDAPQLPSKTPVILADGGKDGTHQMDTMVPDTQYFERYELSGFKAGAAKLKVDLVNEAGAVIFTEEADFDVREHGAVAVYADFKIDPPEEETSGPASSSSAAPSSSSAPTDAGSSEGNITADAASTSDAATSASDAATSTATDAATVPGEAGSSSDAATTGASDGSAAASDASTGG